IRALRRERRLAMSSSDRMVSSSPNSFIKARSFALLIFMRSGLTFSVVATGSSANSASTSLRSVSSTLAVAAPSLGVRPGFFFVVSSAGAAALAGFFNSSLAERVDGFDADTGWAFVTALALPLEAGLETALAAGFVVDEAGLADF